MILYLIAFLKETKCPQLYSEYGDTHSSSFLIKSELLQFRKKDAMTLKKSRLQIGNQIALFFPFFLVSTAKFQGHHNGDKCKLGVILRNQVQNQI